MDAAELDTRIRERIERVPGGIDGRIVRLIIENVPRELFRDLDHRRLREYRARALHFLLDARRPARRPASPDGRGHAPRPLDEEAEDFLKAVWEPTSGEIDRGRLVTLARHYLALAGDDAAQALLDRPAGD